MDVWFSRSGDYGPEPFVVNIDNATGQNNNYRTTVWTGKHMQLTSCQINNLHIKAVWTRTPATIGGDKEIG